MVVSCGLMVRAQCTVRVRVRARDRKWVLFFPALKNDEHLMHLCHLWQCGV